MSQKHKVVKNILLVASAKICSLTSLLAASILVARATDPTSFGYYSVAISIILLIEAIIGAPLDNAVIRFNSIQTCSSQRIGQILGFVFRLKLAIGLLLFILIASFLAYFTEIIFDGEAPHSILIICILSANILLAVRSSGSFLQISKRFSNYSSLDSLQAIFRILLTTILFFLGCTSATLYLLAYGAGTAFAFCISLIKHPQPFLVSKTPSAPDRKIIFSYLTVTSAIVVLGSITGRTDLPLLSAIGGADQAGYYAVAMQLAFAGTLLASYAAIVFQPSVVQMARDNTLNAAINKNVVIALTLTIIGLPIAMHLSPTLIVWVFGDNYQQSANIFNILAIGICADFLSMPLLLPYAIQVIPKQTLFAELVITMVFIISVFFIFQITPESMAWIVTATRIAKLIFYYVLVKISIKNGVLAPSITPL